MKIQDSIAQLKVIGEQVGKQLAGKSTLGIVAAVAAGIGAIAGAALLFARKGNLKARIGELADKLTPDAGANSENVSEDKPQRMNSHARRQRAPVPEPLTN